MFQRLCIACVLALGVCTASAQVYRCGNTYQAEPCAGGRRVEVAPAATAGASPMQTVYLCTSYQGRRFWSEQHCNHHRPPAVLERMVSVPAHLPWEAKLRIARGETAAAEAMVRAAHAPPPRAVAAGPDKRAVCESHSEALRANDRAARAGGTAQYMERLAERRRAIIREQQAANCR